MSDSVLTSYVPLAVTYRNDVLESVHHAAVVALNQDGTVAFSMGDANVGIFKQRIAKIVVAHSSSFASGCGGNTTFFCFIIFNRSLVLPTKIELLVTVSPFAAFTSSFLMSFIDL